MEGHPRVGARERRRERERAGQARRGGGLAHHVDAGGREDAGWPLRGRHLHAQGGRAEGGRERHTRCAQCKIGEQARGGVIEVCGRASEVGCMARYIGSRGGTRAEVCSKGVHACANHDKTKETPDAGKGRASRPKGQTYRAVEGLNHMSKT